MDQYYKCTARSGISGHKLGFLHMTNGFIFNVFLHFCIFVDEKRIMSPSCPTIRQSASLHILFLQSEANLEYGFFWTRRFRSFSLISKYALSA